MLSYDDYTFGDIKIQEPVLEEILESKTLKRLKKISQAGYFEVYFPNTYHTRFEHSLGVLHLLRMYNASLEEQIAGLIHDVSHSAFSHCIDYALLAGSEKKHSHQNNIHQEYVKNTEIPQILKKHGLDHSYILNEKNFPLLEKELPDICADRIEYSLRTLVVYKDINKKAVELILESLKTQNSLWYFKSLDAGLQFAKLFYHANTKYYCGPQSALMFRTVGDVLKYALKKKIIEIQDLYKTDSEVLEKISSFKDDNTLKKLLDRMNRKTKVYVDKSEYDTKVYCKSRIIDPLVLFEGTLFKLSEKYPEWQKIVEKESKPKEYFFQFAD